MYHNKLVASIKANGKILREFKDTTYMPFGAEYSILLKNLNTVRAIVNVFIDGQNVVPGGLVLNAGQEVDLERSLANGSMTGGNKFKFIERTGAIEAHRGVKLEDGLIRVEFQFEKVYLRQDGFFYDDVYTGLYPKGMRGMTTTYAVGSSAINGSVLGSNLNINNVTASSAGAVNQMTAQLSNASVPQNETGITVAGSKSDQKFVTASWFATESEKHTIVLKILGETAENKVVREPVTVKAKLKCDTCGHTNKISSHYCNKCGTALILHA